MTSKISKTKGKGDGLVRFLTNPRGVAKWVVSAAVLLGEVRVWLVVYALSGSIVTATLSLLGTGAWFFVWWHVLDGYRLANTLQKVLDITFTLWSIVVSGIFVLADFTVKVSINNSLIGIDTLIGILAVSTVANILGLLVWLWIDEQSRHEAEAEKRIAKSEHEELLMEVSRESLVSASKSLKLYKKLLDEYSLEALEAVGVPAPVLAGLGFADKGDTERPRKAKNRGFAAFSQGTVDETMPKKTMKPQRASSEPRTLRETDGDATLTFPSTGGMRLEPRKGSDGKIIAFQARSRNGKGSEYYSKRKMPPTEWQKLEEQYKIQSKAKRN